MKKIFYYFILIMFSFYLTDCGHEMRKNCYSNLEKNQNGQTIVRLQQQWFANSGFAGELVAQAITDSLQNIQINVIPGSDQIDTKQIVLLNEAEFGVAGAEQIMQANEKGANLLVIGVINYKSLACFIAKKGKNINTPKDMEGKRIGTMEGSPVDLIYQALKTKEKLNIKTKDEIPTGWVLTGFIRNDYDVYPAFINDEPITLKLQGIDVDIIHPNYYDVNFIGTVYFCKREFAQSCPELVQSFINAVSQGWEIAIKDPIFALSILKSYDKNIDVKKEKESLISGLDYYKGEDGKILYAKKETWENMAKQLIDIDKLKIFEYEKTVDTKFVSWYLSTIKSEK